MRLTLILALLAVLGAGPALAQGGLTIANQEEPTPPRPGVGGDAELPAGFKEIRWGASAEILMAVRGGMERQPVVGKDVTLYIEQAPPGAARRDIVHYRLWRDQLLELRIHYQDTLVGAEAHQFLRRVEKIYGKGKHGRAKTGESVGGVDVIEESWQWEDPFTVQVLIHNTMSREWSMLRRSKVLEDRRVYTEAREAETDQANKVNQIPID